MYSIIDVKSELLEMPLLSNSDCNSRESMNVLVQNSKSLTVVNNASNLIFVEHCYARPHNWKPETNFLRPTKTLFIQHQSNKRKSVNPLAPIQDCEDIIDVISVPPEAPVIYEESKAKYLMDECDRYASCARVNEGDDNWEDTVSKINWTQIQLKLFSGIVNILNNDHLAKLACSGAHNEPILKRVVVDKSVKRIRSLFATVAWDLKLTQWLHQLLMDSLSTPYLAAYLDILQTLKAKLPAFVDKIMYGPNSTNRVGILSNESLFNLFKRPWDPVASSLNLDKPKKLPNNPIIVVVPSVPFASNSSHLKRFHKWMNLLSNLANVQTVHVGTSSLRMTMTNCIDQMLASTRSKIQEVKAQNPGRQIILVGFNAGAALALQVAQVETVLCVLCLGFSLHTAEGRRGDLDDNLLELQCPVLFVIGQCSNLSLQEEMEDLRERMRVETGLIIVGAADDYLRVNKKKKRAEGITQSIVDRCIVDEIGEFVSGILLSPYPPQIRQSSTMQGDMQRRSKIDRKRNNSNGSSLDSEPPSPTPRITRPGQNNSLSPILGRPPGSKSKTKLEAKWAAQGIPKTPSPNSSPNSSLNHSDHTTLATNKLTPKVPLVLDFNKKLTNKIFTPANDIANKTPTIRAASPAAKIHGTTLTNKGILQGSTLSSLLQGAVRASVPKASVGIKENITLSSNSTAKLVSSSGRTIDLSKITVLNSGGVTTSTGGSGYGNLMLMSEKGKAGGVTRYITSKKQLIGNKPPKPMQKVSYNAPTTTSSLLPPVNLTSQDIMDLPIIFADDNQILTSNNENPNVIENVTKVKTTSGKLVFLNKPISSQAPSSMKRVSPFQQMSNKLNKNAVKYAKIILSKKINTDDKSHVVNTPADSAVRTEEQSFENIDLEQELIATAVPKPNFGKDIKNITVIYKKPHEVKSQVEASKPTQTVLNDQLAKRAASQADLSDEERAAKNIKLDNN